MTGVAWAMASNQGETNPHVQARVGQTVGGLVAAGAFVSPYLLTTSTNSRRLRQAALLVALALRDLAARAPSWWDQQLLVDSAPPRCAASRQTIKRLALAATISWRWEINAPGNTLPVR